MLRIIPNDILFITPNFPDSLTETIKPWFVKGLFRFADIVIYKKLEWFSLSHLNPPLIFQREAAFPMFKFLIIYEYLFYLRWCLSQLDLKRFAKLGPWSYV